MISIDREYYPLQNQPSVREKIVEPTGVSTPFVMVIFGVTGDLSQNKLMPALFSLFQQKLFPGDFSIIGFARRGMSHDDLRNFFPSLKNEVGWADFARHLFY
jgi:glucose-6-phosphate 1-dehydrogenase